jgi:glycosyltransferase involved in cell wall biosynthesis
MKIGIDGGALSITDDRLKVGVYRVAYNLVKEMQALGATNDYRVYSFGRGERGIRELSEPNTHFIKLIRRGYQTIWQTIDVLKHPVDVYLGISQSVPWFPKLLCDVKTIGFIYDVGFLEHPEYYPVSHEALKRQTAALVNRSTHIITISQSSKLALQKAYKVADERVTVCYLGVDALFTSVGARHEGKHPYFLFVGSLKPGKNVPMLLRAFADFLTESKKDYSFVIIGSDYWMDPEIPETIAELGLGQRVRIIGYVSDDELATYYRGAVALVSVSLIEGFGLPALEAMRCGCPVIASTVGAYTEVVGEAGILVSPKDRDGVRMAMTRYTMDTEYRSDMIARGKKQAAKFSWHTFARSVLAVIQTVS